jgi:hypothetical protein
MPLIKWVKKNRLQNGGKSSPCLHSAGDDGLPAVMDIDDSPVERYFFNASTCAVNVRAHLLNMFDALSCCSMVSTFAKRRAAVIVAMWTVAIWAASIPSVSSRGLTPFTRSNAKFSSVSSTDLDVPSAASCAIKAFNMVQDDKGLWCWDGFIRECEEKEQKYFALRADWNKFFPKYNAVVAPRRRNFGRPLAASNAQRADVLKRRKAGQSLRSIADDTNLSLRTVRTIIDKADRVDRATLARLERIAPDKLAEAHLRARKRLRDALPQQINALEKRGEDLIKRAKGTR